jgi:cold-inducible RNA-binding protein
MSKRIYVGNMNYNTDDARLREVFGEYGEVSDVHIVTDRDTGRPRGFAFVEMANDSEADKAIAGLNGSDVDGRQLKVAEAQPRAQRSGGFSRRGSGSSSGNRYNDRKNF